VSKPDVPDVERPEGSLAACNPTPGGPAPALETTGGVGPELDDMTLTKAVETKPDQISRDLARRAGRGLLPLLVDDRLPIVGVWVLGRSHGATITILSTALLGRKRQWGGGGASGGCHEARGRLTLVTR
jgi:hypothetical protein